MLARKLHRLAGVGCWYTAAILVFLLIYHDIEMIKTESQHRDHLDGQLSRLILCNFYELQRLNILGLQIESWTGHIQSKMLASKTLSLV